MARGRFISESVAKDLKLNSLSIEAQLVYLMTIPHLDRDGLIEGDTDVLYGTVCPKRRQFIDLIDTFIQEWVDVGLVIAYDTNDGPVLWFKGFAKNQLGLRYERETPSKFPPPPGYMRTKEGIVPIDDADISDTGNDSPPSKGNSVRQNDGQIRQSAGRIQQMSAQWQVQDQVEVKGEVEVEGQPERATPAAAACNPELASIWAMWQDNMPGTITPLIVDQVTSWLREYSAAEIREGIRIAVLRGQRTAKYVEGCLRKGVFSELPAKQTNGNVPAIKADRTAQAFANVRKQLAKKNGVLQ